MKVIKAKRKGTLLDSLPIFRVTEWKHVKGYPFTDRNGDPRFGRFKFDCYRFTLVHRQALPGQTGKLLFSNNKGFEKFTWTSSMGIVVTWTRREFMAIAPGKFGDEAFQIICRTIYK